MAPEKYWDSFPLKFGSGNQSQRWLKKNAGIVSREGRYIPAKGATYPRRALRTREGRYAPAKGATYPRRALDTREGEPS